MRRITYIVHVATMLLCIGCVSKYDDTPIWNEFNEVYERIESLEEKCRNMNGDIQSLQTIMTALQNNDFITAILPITEAGEIIGYTINFTKSGAVTIYNGKDGKDGKDGQDGNDGRDGIDGKDGADGYTPIIGVAEYVDGIYYWTIDGEWLLDNNGNKIRVTSEDGKDGEDGADGKDGEDGADGKDGEDGADGKDGVDGKDGITPILKIENGYWYISYDDGASWSELGRATGEDGKDGTNGADGKDGEDGDSIFNDITYDEYNVYFTLYDGTIITVPIAPENIVEKIQYISHIPTYDDGKELVQFSTPSDSNITLRFEIYPKNIVKDIADNYTQLLAVEATNVATRSSIFTPLQINSCSADTENGIIVLNVGCEPLGSDFFLGLRYMSARLTISDGEYAKVSDFIPLITENHSTSGSGDPDVPEVPIVPAVRDNQIVYTTTDGKPIKVNGDFNSLIASNIYEEGRGIITFHLPLKKIDSHAFNQCSTMTSIVIPNQVHTIGDRAFNGCSELVAVYLGDKVRDIEAYAFTGCIKINSIEFGDSLEYIYDYAFSNCDNLINITLPNSVKEIAIGAFSGCQRLESVVIGDGVTTIRSHAFGGCLSLTEITIPDNVIKLENEAFKECSSLEHVIIGKGVKVIEKETFRTCTELKSVTLGENIERIEQYAFESCTHLTSINFPGSLRYIGQDAFWKCERLSVISLMPDNELEIDSSAFSMCTRLTRVDMGMGVKKIGSFAFSNCSSLTTINIPESVERIENSAFQDCYELTSITFPESVTEIGAWAFRYCNKLADIYCLSSTPPYAKSEYHGWSSFDGCADTLRIHIPDGALTAYSTADGWSAYASKYVVM